MVSNSSSKVVSRTAGTRASKFPLTARGDGRWCKKVNGRMHYFTGSRDEALAEWMRTKEDIIHGREVRPAGVGLTLGVLCSKYLTHKKTNVDLGRLSPRTFVEYSRATDGLISAFGSSRLVADLRPDDFQTLYAKLSKKHGLTTLGREITMVRSVFKYALENDLADKAVKFGSSFKAPSKAEKRKQRSKRKAAHGARAFEAADIRRMLEAAGPQLKAMILLGINGGLGNTDCSTLPLSAIKDGWLDFPRPKTGIDRRVPLWPETVTALEAVISAPRKPRSDEFKGLVFLTRLGQPWVRYELAETPDEAGKVAVTGKADDGISKAMRGLLDDLGIYRPGLSFYTLRHTFETVAGETADQVAVDALMGHVDTSMAAEYRESISDGRLLAVTNAVRAWLYPDAPAAT